MGRKYVQLTDKEGNKCMETKSHKFLMQERLIKWIVIIVKIKSKFLYSFLFQYYFEKILCKNYKFI